MKKILIATAVAAAIVIPATGVAGTSLYGDLRWSVADKDDDGAGVDDTQYVNNNTRLGLKGSYDGGNGMSAFFHTQIGLNSQDNGTFNSQAFTNQTNAGATINSNSPTNSNNPAQQNNFRFRTLINALDVTDVSITKDDFSFTFPYCFLYKSSFLFIKIIYNSGMNFTSNLYFVSL